MAQIQEYENLVLDALEVVEFQLIRERSDLSNEAFTFHPLMAHQIFGDSESIFGYQDLRIHIWYTACSLQIYLGVQYGNKIDDLSNGDIKADDVITTIASKLPAGCYFINLDEFLKTLDKADKFQPFGEKLGEYHKRMNDADANNERHFEFYNCNYRVPAFLKFFARLQTFILWFIDAASYIDKDDMSWNYFVCYEKYKNSNGEYQYATVGYTTVYEYYAYPQNTRPRISQMLLLPPFQKLGLGSQFLEIIYKYYQSQKKVIDITVEDPSDDFKRLRNFVDARLCMQLKTFAPAVIKKGFCKEMIHEAREIFKINPRQARIIYEILRLYYTNIHSSDEYKSYRLDIKKRLNILYHKQIAKIDRVSVNMELLRARLPTSDARLDQLKKEYEEVEHDYKIIIDKLKGEYLS